MKSLFAAILFLSLSSAALAAPIHGVVTNQTTGKPAAGDTVSLIRLQQGMQVAAHTTVDASGHYTLDINDSEPMHLVRVTHNGVNYFQAAPPGKQKIDVTVYDAAEKVSGVSTEADVQRIDTDQGQLRITENYFVKNTSSPPRTQFGPHPYEIFLPKAAQIVSSAALGPGSMPVQSSPIPVGPPGEYTFVFPLRPGETRFQVSYRVPYSGSMQFRPRVAMPVDNLALILPKSMHFASQPSAAFQPIDQDANVQTYLARHVLPGATLGFRISGTGQLPQETSASSSGPSGAAPANPETAAREAANSSTRPGIGLGVPLDTPSPLDKYKWWIISLAAVLLAIGAGVSMKRTAPPANPATAAALPPLPLTQPGAPAGRRPALLETLKEEMFALETDRLEGRVTAEEYERQKSALDLVLQRALDRNKPAPTGAAV